MTTDINAHLQGIQENVLQQAKEDCADLVYIVDAIHNKLCVAFPKTKAVTEFYVADITDEMMKVIVDVDDMMTHAACYYAVQTINELELEPVEFDTICGATFMHAPNAPKINNMMAGEVSIFTEYLIPIEKTVH